MYIPMLKCKNGHAVCKTCCHKLKSKCPVCRLQIDCRCRPLEEIMKSLKVKCKNKDYGCKDLVSYCNRDDHEKNCIYEPYPCPQPACHFRGLSNNLSQHFCTQHALYTKTFRYNSLFALALSKNQKIYVLKEVLTGDLFVWDNTIANSNRNKVRISFVRQSPSGRVVGHSYELKVTAGSNGMKFCGRTNNVSSISDEPNAPTLLILRNAFLEFKDKFFILVKLFPSR